MVRSARTMPSTAATHAPASLTPSVASPRTTGIGHLRWGCFARLLVAWCLPLVVSIGLLFPMALLAKEGLTSTGIREETTGYRYFHTLRILYGQHERPYQTQGYASGLVDMGI